MYGANVPQYQLEEVFITQTGALQGDKILLQENHGTANKSDAIFLLNS